MNISDKDIEGFCLKSDCYKKNAYIKLIKYDKDIFEIIIRSRNFSRDYDKIYQLKILIEYSSTKLGIRNMFHKRDHKIKANKVENMLELYLILKNIVSGNSYDKDYLIYIIEQITQTYGFIKKLNLKKIKEYKKIYYCPKMLIKNFKSIEDIAKYLEDDDILFS